MIGEDKVMIAGCIDRKSRDGCEGCERRDPCTALFRFLGLRRRAESSGALGEDRPRTAANPFTAFLSEVAKAEGRATPGPSAFRAEVERRIEALLPSGAVRIDEVARALGYGRQTLYRRLKAEGLTFEQLLDDLRRRLALKLVRDEGVPVKEAAYRLGFSDPAAFSRAYKRWTGASPRGPRRRPAQPG
jgi:AraC-like DNA-binding protein